MMHNDEELSNLENSNVVDDSSFMGLDTPMDSTVDGALTYNYDDASYAYSDALIGDNSVTPRIPILPNCENSITNVSSVGSSFLRHYYDESHFADDEHTVKYSHAGRLSNSVVSPIDDTQDSREEEDTTGRSCVPSWITNASTTIKFVILLSTALLVGCLALISIASTVPVSDSPKAAQSNTESIEYKTFWPTASPMLGEVPTKVTIPVPTPNTKEPTKSPTLAPVVITKEPTNDPTLSPIVATNNPTESPTVSPIVITNDPTNMPTSALPTSTPTLPTNIISFYVMSRYRSPDLGVKVGSLPSSDVDFLIHLGNWNNANPEKCRPKAYRRTATQFENSTVPVLFVPGRDEWNFCPDPIKSQNVWRTSFVDSEDKYVHEFDVTRQRTREENFAFVHKNALIIGLNMVGGDDAERAERLNDNVKWVKDTLNDYWKTIDTVIFFGNTGLWGINSQFFDEIKVLIESYNDIRPDVTFFYIKESKNDISLDDNVMEVENFSILNIEANQWPPLKVSVDTNNRHTLLWIY
jgi:hypothetical protein